MRALLVSLALLGACDAGAKPEPRPKPDVAVGKPMVFIKGGEITFKGLGSNADAMHSEQAKGAKCDVTATGDLHCTYPDPPVPCEWVIAKVPSVAFAYDPSYFALAATIEPTLLVSCGDDHWPEDLKQCLLHATPQQIVHEHTCDKLVTPDLRSKVAKRFGVAPDQVQSMLVP